MTNEFKSTENLTPGMNIGPSNAPPPLYEDISNSPPNYNDAVGNQSEQPPSGAGVTPPSYESLFGNIRAAHEEHASSNKVAFLRKVAGILMNTIGYTVMLTVMYLVPIAMIVIGSLKLNNCPAENQIPVFLIVFGVALIVKNTLSLIQQVKRYRQNNPEEQTKKHPGEGVIDAFLLIWFVAGNIWVYRIFNNVQYETKESDHYCDRLVYLFAFWCITIVYIFCATVITCCCCMCCVAVCCNRNNQQTDNSAQP